MKKRKDPPGSVPPDHAATEAEIYAAVEGLSDADRVRLQNFARARLRGVSPAQLKSRDWQDLVVDAVTKTLDRTRRWRKTVPFVHHMLGVMRSTANHWSEEANPDPAIPASRLERFGPDDAVETPYLEAPDGALDPEQALQVKETLGHVREHFKEDWLISLVMDAFGEGHRPSELRELGVSDRDVQAALKKLRRHARELFPQGGKR